MKTVLELEVTIERRLARTWHLEAGGAKTNWPYEIALGQPTSVELEADFATWSRQSTVILSWAKQNNLTVRTRDRRVHGSTQPFPTAVIVPDVATAAAICGADWVQRRIRREIRSLELRKWFPDSCEYPKVLRLTDSYTDLDFGLLIDVATWFEQNSANGMTPRQVPVPGVHAKWLNTHGPAVEAIIGRPLELARRHPPRIHFTYLDPEHLAAGGRRHDSATVGDAETCEYQPDIVLIIENKDTAIHFPEIRGGIAIEGDGFGGTTVCTFPWITGARHLFYWGDIDASGFEILAGYRRDGVDVTSILMNLNTYRTYAPWGTHIYPNGEPIARRKAKDLIELTAEEKEAYLVACDTASELPPRVEQERIPLAVAHLAVACLADLPNEQTDARRVSL